MNRITAGIFAVALALAPGAQARPQTELTLFCELALLHPLFPQLFVVIDNNDTAHITNRDDIPTVFKVKETETHFDLQAVSKEAAYGIDRIVIDRWLGTIYFGATMGGENYGFSGHCKRAYPPQF